MKESRLRVGVVGLGMGKNHAESYRGLTNAELTAICDTDEAWAEHLQEQWSVPSVFADYLEMFASDEVDAVSIALPTHLHHPATVAALQSGKHVLIEKPMAMNAAEAESMATAARNGNRVLMISMNQRFGQDAVFIKRCVEQGHLGQVYFARSVWRRPLGCLPPSQYERPTGTYHGVNWFNEAEKGGGAARDLGAHMIDLAMWFMGFPEIESVSGGTYTMFGPEAWKGKGVKFDADDHAVGFVRFSNGATLQIEISYGQHTDKQEVVTELFGSEGGVYRSALDHCIKLFGSQCGGYTTAEVRLQEITRSPQAEFVESILEERQPLVTLEQGIAVMRVIDGIYGAGPRVTKS